MPAQKKECREPLMASRISPAFTPAEEAAVLAEQAARLLVRY
jgi:hypothetical protein